METGKYLVKTTHSEYVLDMDTHPITTIEQNDGTLATAVGVLMRKPQHKEASTLRRDEDSIPIVSLVTCEVGQSLVMILDIRKDGVLTIRSSTEVQSIETLL